MAREIIISPLSNYSGFGYGGYDINSNVIVLPVKYVKMLDVNRDKELADAVYKFMEERPRVRSMVITFKDV